MLGFADDPLDLFGDGFLGDVDIVVGPVGGRAAQVDGGWGREDGTDVGELLLGGGRFLGGGEGAAEVKTLHLFIITSGWVVLTNSS